MAYLKCPRATRHPVPSDRHALHARRVEDKQDGSRQLRPMTDAASKKARWC
jgi:hypothetical protein